MDVWHGGQFPSVARRRLDSERIAGYQPESTVTDQNAIDLDQEVFEWSLSQWDFSLAKQIYIKGGHSKSYADMTVGGIAYREYAAGSRVTGTDFAGRAVTGTLMDDLHVCCNCDCTNCTNCNSCAETTMQVLYDVKDVQASYVDCQVGGLPQPQFAGCFDGSVITLGNDIYEISFAPLRLDNKNARTLQTVATEGWPANGTTGCGFREFCAYSDYFGGDDYANTWVMAALDGTRTNFLAGRGVSDFSTATPSARMHCARIGSSMMILWMAVIAQIEDGVRDCIMQCNPLSGACNH
eukprot:5171164-Prymnesium_polylepis.1